MRRGREILKILAMWAVATAFGTLLYLSFAYSIQTDHNPCGIVNYAVPDEVYVISIKNEKDRLAIFLHVTGNPATISSIKYRLGNEHVVLRVCETVNPGDSSITVEPSVQGYPLPEENSTVTIDVLGYGEVKGLVLSGP